MIPTLQLHARGGNALAIAKVIQVIGHSPESFAKAADQAVREASKSVRGITGADVVSMSANVEDGRITNFKTTVNIAFAVEGTD
jgi:flavin-binding protein dodecin